MAPKTPSIIGDAVNVDLIEIDDGQEGLDDQFCNQETNHMESAVINASGDPRAVVFSDGHNRNHHDQHELRTDANYRALAAEVERFGVANGDRIHTTGAAGALAAAHIGEAVRDTSCATDRLVQVTGAHTNELVQGTSCRTDGIVTTGFAGVQAGFSSVHDRLCDGFDKTRATVVHGTEEARKEYDQLQKQISDAATSTLVGFKDLTALSYQIQGAALLEAAKNTSAITVQATNNANAASVQAQNFTNLLQVQAMTNFNALSVEMVKNAAAAELRAQQIAAAAAAAAAECCCELKALITSDGNTTRALINTNTIEALRAQLVATQRLVPLTIAVGAG